MPASGSLGERGEFYASKYLEKKGYEILHRNWRKRSGEIDLIAKYQDALIFIEVKTRRSDQFGKGIESVDERKQNKLRQLAELYLTDTNQHESECRFEIVVITQSQTGTKVEHFEQAF